VRVPCPVRHGHPMTGPLTGSTSQLPECRTGPYKRDHLDVGRPESVSLIFDRRVSRCTPAHGAPGSSPRGSIAPRSGWRCRVRVTAASSRRWSSSSTRGRPGAFVDLAADLAWLTARPPSDFVLDQHLPGPAGMGTAANLFEASVFNQAIGALGGQGHTLQQADRHDVQAVDAGVSRHAARLRILAGLTGP
jgi:hypothetical protein